MKRILQSLNHYDALGFSRHKKIDAAVLKKEYRKKVFVQFSALSILVYFSVIKIFIYAANNVFKQYCITMYEESHLDLTYIVFASLLKECLVDCHFVLGASI